jgi:hypothetical protein
MAQCPECRHDNIEGALFCEECGAGLDQGAPLSALRSRRQTDQLIDPYAGGPDADRLAPVILDDRETDTAQAAPGRVPAAFFLLTTSGRHIPLPAQEQVIIGRADARSGVRPDVDLTLEGAGQAGVSRRHCRLIWHEGEWLVEDLMSTNYTLVNGSRIPSHTPTSMAVGDELRLGKLTLTLGQGTRRG